jgi:superfamily I DNA/RNA helicase
MELSTIHKAKGREWERVFVLRHDLLMPKWLINRADKERRERDVVSVTTAQALEQEMNLKYVAYTRAKYGLYLLHDEVERVA